MKAIIEFSLPEEKYEHRQAVFAADAWMALKELDQELRNLLKYRSDEAEKMTGAQLAKMLREDTLCPILSKLDEV